MIPTLKMKKKLIRVKKKLELDNKMNGVTIRYRENWLKDGEKASKFFFNLEKNIRRKS